MGLTDDLVRLEQLRRDGVLTDEEFARAKAAVLTAPVDVSGAGASDGAGPDDTEADGAPPRRRAAARASARADEPDDVPTAERRARAERQWSMYIHFSVLAGVVVPLAGFVLPIVLWQTKRDELPGVDAHGKAVANWLISALIYGVASSILVFALVGIPLLIALAVLSIVFPILGGLRAGEGRLWTYPLSIRFLG